MKAPLRIRVAEWLLYKLDFYVMDWYYEQERTLMDGLTTNWDEMDTVTDEEAENMGDAEWDEYWQKVEDERNAMREETDYTPGNDDDKYLPSEN